MAFGLHAEIDPRAGYRTVQYAALSNRLYLVGTSEGDAYVASSVYPVVRIEDERAQLVGSHRGLPVFKSDSMYLFKSHVAGWIVTSERREPPDVSDDGVYTVDTRDDDFFIREWSGYASRKGADGTELRIRVSVAFDEYYELYRAGHMAYAGCMLVPGVYRGASGEEISVGLDSWRAEIDDRTLTIYRTGDHTYCVGDDSDQNTKTAGDDGKCHVLAEDGGHWYFVEGDLYASGLKTPRLRFEKNGVDVKGVEMTQASLAFVPSAPAYVIDYPLIG